MVIYMTQPASDGGDQVNSYQLQLKLPNTNTNISSSDSLSSTFDYSSTVWQTVMGEYNLNMRLQYALTNDSLPTGQYVQARYRCKNFIGWSDWSVHSYLLMAGVPVTPARPTYISSTDTSISIQLYQSSYSNGSPIMGYEVWLDEGDNTSEVNTKDNTYDGVSMQHVVTGLNPGMVYKIAVRAFNSQGYSEMSYYTAIGGSQPPSQVQLISKVTEMSAIDAIGVEW